LQKQVHEVHDLEFWLENHVYIFFRTERQVGHYPYTLNLHEENFIRGVSEPENLGHNKQNVGVLEDVADGRRLLRRNRFP